MEDQRVRTGRLGRKRLRCRVFVRMRDSDAFQGRGVGMEEEATPSSQVQGLRGTVRDMCGTPREP